MTQVKPAGDPLFLAGWREHANVSGHAADWLHIDRLVTADIVRSFESTMALTVIAAGEATLPEAAHSLLADDGHEGWLREITITSGDALLIHAVSFMPQTACEANPWFTGLDHSVLGNALAKREYAQRSPMRFLRSPQTPAPFGSIDGAWARRSVFDVEGGSLLLIEHMTETLLGTPRMMD
ncbi:MAG: chorismate lyase [Woeseiaceae bacterium]